TIGIFGPWGSGKTSLMQLTAEALEGKYKAPPAVWFNAWHYDKEEALWRALVVRVLAELRPDVPDDRKPTDDEAKLTKKLDDLEASLYKVVQREELGGVTVDWGQAAKGVAMGTVHLGLSLMPGLAAFSKLLEKGQEKIAGDDITLLFDAVQREKQKIYREHVRSMEQFRKEFADIVKEQVIDQDRRLIVFIDDLDRCLPEKAIEVLEALKLFLDVPGCVFFLGVDRQIIQRGIQVKYKGFLVDGDDPEAAARRIPISGDDYLEKIVQLPFHLLPLDRNRIRQFIERGAYDLPEGCDDVFATGLEANPRKVKRALHIFLLLQKLAQLRRGEFKVGGETVPVVPPLLAKIVVIQSRYRNLYQDLTEAPAFLRYLERHMLGEIEPDETVDARFTRWLELYR
ncbi:MAG: hypothetical protein GY803_08300, partial [Chloroflexi bacterium]|nr:hypothetical protein [Chloroflexota bacterium]